MTNNLVLESLGHLAASAALVLAVVIVLVACLGFIAAKISGD
jgi:hypothetical protein